MNALPPCPVPALTLLIMIITTAGTRMPDPRCPALTERRNRRPQQKENTMLGWALTFLLVALVAAALGFGGIAGTSAGIAKILFWIFIILFVVSLIARVLKGKPPL